MIIPSQLLNLRSLNATLIAINPAAYSSLVKARSEMCGGEEIFLLLQSLDYFKEGEEGVARGGSFPSFCSTNGRQQDPSPGICYRQKPRINPAISIPIYPHSINPDLGDLSPLLPSPTTT